ncbi:hypothetical protein BASA83_010030 [Batrachochytrium salamandrivorans]|nr:hypothetical protein BASA81_011393 [Batrachochytrium salamandrivorans]KAH9267297.1 hypothetical protein BASA83_010030 [Batrachochytrium salamandrivorans]
MQRQIKINPEGMEFNLASSTLQLTHTTWSPLQEKIPDAYGFAALDWKKAAHIQLRKMSGARTSLAVICGSDPQHKTVLVFLKISHMRSIKEQFIIFTCLRATLMQKNISVVFIGCTKNLSELTQFIKNYTHWLQINSDEGMLSLAAEFYLDPYHEAYLFMGLCGSIETFGSLKMCLGFQRRVKNKQIGCPNGQSAILTGFPKSAFSMIASFISWNIGWLFKIKHIIKRPSYSSGLFVVKDNSMIYQHIIGTPHGVKMSNLDKNTIEIDAPNADYQGCDLDNSEKQADFIRWFRDAIADPIDSEEVQDVKSDYDGLKNGHALGILSEKITPSELHIQSEISSTSSLDIILNERIGQGRESEVFLGKFDGVMVAVKYFRRPITPPSALVASQGAASSIIRSLKSLQNPKMATNAIGHICDTRKYSNESDETVSKKGNDKGRNMYVKSQSTERSVRVLLDASETITSFSNEVAMLMAISHSNIIKLMGFGTVNYRHFIMIEYMARGSLFDVLGSKERYDGERKSRMAIDVARGIGHLHQHGILHNDIKSLNMLVGEDWVVKVADFGIAMELSRIKKNPYRMGSLSKSLSGYHYGYTLDGSLDSEGNDLVRHGGTLQWLAPEYLLGQTTAPSTKCDIFAFGMILWEIATQKTPWRGVSSRIIETSVVAGGRPPKSESWTLSLRHLVEACWHQDRKLRPEFPRILQDLARIKFPGKSESS